MGFDYCEPEKKTTQLLCSVYMDLPHSYQAYLFATININQRKVDKSLAYDQFGYNVDDEERSGWAPDKLAVFFTRRLNLDPESPFYGRIKVAPLNAELLFPEGYIPDWQVSTACVVEGIVKLISQNSKADRDLLHKKVIGSRSRSQLPKDSSPMRGLYLAGQDEKLYHQIEDFFKVAKDNLWVSATQRSYIRKTVGIQALFDVLRSVVENTGRNPAVSETNSILGSSSGVDFSDPVFQASGKGRVLIRNTILLYADLIPSQALPDQDRKLYLDLLKKYPKPKNGGQ